MYVTWNLTACVSPFRNHPVPTSGRQFLSASILVAFFPFTGITVVYKMLSCLEGPEVFGKCHLENGMNSPHTVLSGNFSTLFRKRLRSPHDCSMKRKGCSVCFGRCCSIGEVAKSTTPSFCIYRLHSLRYESSNSSASILAAEQA